MQRDRGDLPGKVTVKQHLDEKGGGPHSDGHRAAQAETRRSRGPEVGTASVL